MVRYVKLARFEFRKKKTPGFVGPGWSQRTLVEGKGKVRQGNRCVTSSVQTRPLQDLDVLSRAAEVARDDPLRFLRAASRSRLPVELDHAAKLLESARLGLLDQEVGVELDAHGPQTNGPPQRFP